MQLMAENNTEDGTWTGYFRTRGPQGDKKGDVGPRSKLPTFDGTSRWGAYVKHPYKTLKMSHEMKW